MKRGVIALFLLVLLVSPMILAEENNSTKERINIFQTNVTIPSFDFLYLIETPEYKFNLTWVQLIVYIVAVSFIFIATLEILGYTSFETPWVKALIAGALVVVIGIFGLLQMLVDFFYAGLDNFRLIAWIIVALITAGLLVKPIMGASKKHKRLSKAEQLGKVAGAVLKSQKKTGEASAKEVSKS